MVSDHSPVPLAENKLRILGGWDRVGDGQRSDQRPFTRAPAWVWTRVRGGSRPGALPSGRAQASAPNLRRGANPASGAHPGRLSGPAASSSPPRPSDSRGRPRTPFAPGLAAAAAATRQRSAASPSPGSQARRGECLRGGLGARPGGLCLQPSPAAGLLERAVSPLSRRAPPPQPSPWARAGLREGSTVDPGSGSRRRQGATRVQPCPQPCLPSLAGGARGSVGPALSREAAGGGWAGSCDRGGPGCAGGIEADLSFWKASRSR